MIHLMSKGKKIIICLCGIAVVAITIAAIAKIPSVDKKGYEIVQNSKSIGASENYNNSKSSESNNMVERVSASNDRDDKSSFDRKKEVSNDGDNSISKSNKEELIQDREDVKNPNIKNSPPKDEQSNKTNDSIQTDDDSVERNSHSTTEFIPENANDNKTSYQDVVLYADDIEAKLNDKDIRYDIKIKHNPGILGMKLSVYYDEDMLELKKAVNGDAFSGVLNLTKSKGLSSGCSFLWDGQEVFDEEIKDGSILELYFDIKAGVDFKTQQISVVCENDDVIDKDLKTVNLSTINGTIKTKH